MVTHAKDPALTHAVADLLPKANMLLRGLGVLECVAESPNRTGVSVGEVASRTGLEKSTVSRTLAILREAGYVRQDGYRRYRLTGKLTTLSQGYSNVADLLVAARPHLESLHAEFDEEVHLATLDQGYMVFVDYIPSSQVVRSTLSTTQRLIHETAAGRAALCLLDHEARVDALRLSADAGGTSFNADQLAEILAELDGAKERGWAGYDRGDEVSRFAAPILDESGEPLAAVCLSGPTFRIRGQEEAYGAAVVHAAREISATL